MFGAIIENILGRYMSLYDISEFTAAATVSRS